MTAAMISEEDESLSVMAYTEEDKAMILME
jgi:hypothetical protein